jgi:hypothetical protein
VFATLSIGTSNHNAWWSRFEKRGPVSNSPITTIAYAYSNDVLNAQRKLVVGGDDARESPMCTMAAFLWNRELSYEEHLELTDNPWQLFAPLVARTFFMPPPVVDGHKFLGWGGRRLRTHNYKLLRTL